MLIFRYLEHLLSRTFSLLPWEFEIALSTVFPLKFQIKGGFPFSFTSLQKCLANEFFNLQTIASYHYIQYVTLHKNLVCLAITNLKYKNYKNSYQFLLLLSGDVSLNPAPVQISPAWNTNNWEPLNKKVCNFFILI